MLAVGRGQSSIQHARYFSLSPSEGERAGERGASNKVTQTQRQWASGWPAGRAPSAGSYSAKSSGEPRFGFSATAVRITQ